MNTLSKLVLGGAVVVALVLWVAQRANHPRVAAEEPQSAAAPAALTPPPAPVAVSQAPAPGRESSASSEVAPEPRAEPVAAQESVAGLVIDPEGVPVGGVGLGLRSSRGVTFDLEFSSYIAWDGELEHGRGPLAFSAADGRFVLPRPDPFSGYVVAQDERFETVLAANVHSSQGSEPVLVVAPRFRLRGQVVDAQGRPLEGAELAFLVPRERVQAGTRSLDGARDPGWRGTSDADGRFAFERLPAVGGAELRVRLEPFVPRTIARATWLDDELEIVLAEPAGEWLEGVVESAGRPLAGATVALGYRATTTDKAGAFRLSLAELQKEDELVALARGLLPTRVKGDRNADGTVRWPASVRIELAGETLALAGKLVDEAGAPLPAHEIWIEDPGIAFAQSQGFAMTLESILVGTPEMRHGSKTDEEGRFRIEGLEERDYKLRVIDPRTALLVDLGPFAAGEEDLVLQRPSGLLWPRLRGRVVSRTGTPLAGLQLSIDRSAGMIGVRNQYFGFLAYGTRAVSAADGSFELLDVPREGATLHVRGEGTADPELELGPSLDPDNLEVRVARSVQLQVRLSSAHSDADSFAVLDAAGAELDLTRPTGGGTMTSPQAPFANGSSDVVRLSDDGVTLVLYRGGEELARVPLVLQPGATNTLDL